MRVKTVECTLTDAASKVLIASYTNHKVIIPYCNLDCQPFI